jgi:uncharacterized protein (DUF1330 family)
MTGYWVVQSTPRNDPEAARKYADLWTVIAKKYQAQLLAGPETHRCLEGEEVPRLFIVRFPSYEQAVACYEGPEYQAALPYALRAYRRSFFVLREN